MRFTFSLRFLLAVMLICAILAGVACIMVSIDRETPQQRAVRLLRKGGADVSLHQHGLTVFIEANPCVSSLLGFLGNTSSQIELTIQSNTVNTDLMSHVVDLRNLTGLYLNECYVTRGAMNLICQMPHLKSLGITKSRTEDGWSGFLSTMQQLQHLDLSGLSLSKADISALEGNNALHSLRLFRSVLTHEAWAALSKVSSIAELIVAESNLTDSSIVDIATLPNLEQLNVGSCKVSDVGVAHLALTVTLCDLALYGTQITSHGVGAIADLAALTSLDLSDTSIDDCVFLHLTAFKSLESIDLTHTSVTLPGLEQFLMKHNQTLRLVRVTGGRFDRVMLEQLRHRVGDVLSVD